ncbi:YqxA family protein [Aquibacillus sp. 3ASR75-11]|uniref:YqxA family protein n=1 Tax=Terrihalobacillus insolitus TaxID=2950438 RepID=A0A9X4ANV1_9BACI|nr:DUF3679 domain-containing protein [Terrihalobacillus insolitus]MDC3413330.1 YqxA family protein [Terrihalobacillus insolitus]MDC3424913.1 YqxA family protein [Terrihalobacillus insolitus]
MVKTIITLLMMIILFLGGTLFGIDQASEGIIQTRGYATADVKEAVQPSRDEAGNVEVELLGKDLQQVTFEEKEQEFQEIESSNFTQKLAGSMEKGVSSFYNLMIQSVYQLVQVFF